MLVAGFTIQGSSSTHTCTHMMGEAHKTDTGVIERRPFVTSLYYQEGQVNNGYGVESLI